MAAGLSLFILPLWPTARAHRHRIVICAFSLRSLGLSSLLLPSIGSAPLAFSLILSAPSPLHPRSVNFSFSQENEWRGLPVIGSSAARPIVFHLLRIQRSEFLVVFPHGGSNMGGNYRTFFFILRERDNETKALFCVFRLTLQDIFYFVDTKRFKV